MLTKANQLAKKTWDHFMSDSLYRNSVTLMLATGYLSFTGFLFWFLAARIYTPAEVGSANILINASTFLAQFSFLGLDIALIRYLPSDNKRSHEKIHTAMTLAAITTCIVSLIYLFVMQSTSHEIYSLTASIGMVVLIVTTMILSTWSVLTNSVFTAYKINQYALYVSLVFGTVRLVLLFILAQYSETGLFLAYAIALFLGVLAGWLYLKNKINYQYRTRIYLSEAKQMAKYSLSSYFANVSLMISSLLLPSIIIITLTAAHVAYYAIPLMLMNMLNIVAISSGQALLAEGSWDRNDIMNKLKKTLRSTMIILIPSVAVCIIFGERILGLFGENYSRHGYSVLVILCCATIFRAISYLASVIFRIEDRIKIIMIGTFLYMISTLGIGYLLLRKTHDLSALSIVVLVSEALLMMFYLYILKFYKTRKFMHK